MAGDRVAADARLIESTFLQADESQLSGESVPVAKGLDPVAEDAPVAERSSMVFSGTVLTRGAGLAVVTSRPLAMDKTLTLALSRRAR